MLYREIIEIETKQGVSFVDITERVAKAVMNSGIREGLCNVFVTATTAGITINESERLLLEDFKRLFKTLVDEKKLYSHPENAFSHLRASLLSAEKTIPVANSKLILGKWQSILLWEFDVEERKRQVVVTVTGE